MKGDFSRLTFDEVDRYSRVLMQQGRVLLDADWNESAEIQIQDLRALARDVMGPHAAPAGQNGEDGAGFLIQPRVDDKNVAVPNDFSIGEGRYYVQGILCRNLAGTAYRAQPDWPDDKAAFVDGKNYLVYLDVWERHITGTEDDGINEPALNGADTCTRSEIVWQVRIQIISASAAAKADSLKADYKIFLDALGLSDPGRLAARVDKPADSDTPCISAPESKYRGAGNQLYRVEIHTSGLTPRFKWSRDNGSQIYPVVDLSGAIVTLQSTGRDDRSSLQPDDMVELIDDQYTILNRAAPLLRVSTVNRETNQVTLDPAPPVSKMGTHPYLRRWDSGEIDISKAAAATVDGWISLEDGVQVKFAFDVKKQQFVTGQYWTIPARTATGDVIWPQESGKPAFRTPQGIDHAYAPLAVVSFKADRTFDKAVDLRRMLTKAWK